MITAIEIENFKAIGARARIELKPLTLVFGRNSAGKSSIVQALHYAQEIFERHSITPDRTFLGGDTMDLGGFPNFVHNHDLRRPVRLRLDLRLDHDKLPNDYDPREIVVVDEDAARGLNDCSSAWVEVALFWDPMRKGAEVREYSVGLEGNAVAGIAQGEKIREVVKDLSTLLGDQSLDEETLNAQTLLHFNWRHPWFRDGKPLAGLRRLTHETLEWGLSPDDKSFVFMRRPTVASFPSALPEWGERLSIEVADEIDFEDESNVVSGLTRMIVGPGELARDYLRTFRYLGPIRAIPPRNLEPWRAPDTTRWANGLAAWDLLSQADEKMVAHLNQWLSTRLKSGYTLRLKELAEIDPRTIPAADAVEHAVRQFAEIARKASIKSKIALVPDGESIEVQPHDVGIGISQLLPVVMLAVSSYKELIAIEQPELHLHPALQAELGDLFIESALGKCGNTVILETHSEHLILRLLRRIRETHEDKLPPGAPALRPDQVSVIYVDRTEQGVQVLPMRIDTTGEFIDRWPKGFFEEREDELF